MYEEIKINYLNPTLNLGLQDIRNVWLLNPVPVKLSTTIHRGTLVFRLPVSGKRISYKSLKRGLIKKEFIIRLPYQLLPF